MIKTSELINKLTLASEASCQCEDENIIRIVSEAIGHKSKNAMVTVEELVTVMRAITDFSRFASIRTACKVLQDLELIENDVDVMDNNAFRNELSKCFK